MKPCPHCTVRNFGIEIEINFIKKYLTFPPKIVDGLISQSTVSEVQADTGDTHPPHVIYSADMADKCSADCKERNMFKTVRNVYKILAVMTISTMNFSYWYKYNNQPNSGQAEQRLPDVIIPGIKKCGTGALIEMLKLHPNIVAPNYGSTENSFFDDNNWSKGVQYFISKMARGLPDQLILTKSQSLIEFPNTEIIYRKLEECPAQFPAILDKNVVALKKSFSFIIDGSVTDLLETEVHNTECQDIAGSEESCGQIGL